MITNTIIYIYINTYSLQSGVTLQQLQRYAHVYRVLYKRHEERKQRYSVATAVAVDGIWYEVEEGD